MKQRNNSRRGEGKSGTGEPARALAGPQSQRETGARCGGEAGGGQMLKASPYRVMGLPWGQEEPQRVSSRRREAGLLESGRHVGRRQG